MNKLKKMAEFKTETEEREFWESHDSTDYMAQIPNHDGITKRTEMVFSISLSHAGQPVMQWQ